MRKRLYLRLGIVAALLCTSVWGIAQLQSATRYSKEKEKKQVAANTETKEQHQPNQGANTPRRPQPIPGRQSPSEVPIPDDDYSDAGNDDEGGDDGQEATANSRSNNSRWNSYSQGTRGAYSVLSDEQEEETKSGDDNDTEDATADESSAAEDPPDLMNDVAHEQQTNQKKKNRYSLDDDTSDSISDENDEGQSASPAVEKEVKNDMLTADDSESDAGAESTQTNSEREPGLLISPDSEEDDDADAELDAENPATLAETMPQAARPLPSRTSGTLTPRGNSKSVSSSAAPPLLSTSDSARPIRPNVNDSVSLDPQSVPEISSGAANSSSELLGMQTQQVTIEKIAPDEVQVGRQATFEILVRNVGQSTANNVVVIDRVPEGAVLVETNPPATNNDGVLTWNLGSMDAGSDAQLRVTVTPQVEGEISSVATVTFAAQAAARTVSTKPVLKIDVQSPQQVLIGDWVNVVITVSNEGSGPARGVVIEADIPEGLNHPAGRELEHDLGTIRNRDEQQLTLVLAAEKAGSVAGMIRVHDDGHVDLQQPLNLEVVAPQLAVAVEGPKLRYLGRQATYTVSVANNGTATANNVELVAVLPPNLQFVSADKLGQYDLQQHAVYWNLEQLPANKIGSVRLVTLPIQEGERKLLRVEAHADLAQSVETPHDVTVSSIAELSFSISDSADPIEVGTETIYEIEVTNQGSKADSNVVLAIGFPEELEPLKGEGPTRAQVSGQQIQFEPLGQLAAGDSVVYRIQAKGRIAGDPRILVRLISDQMPKPVSKEESTKVYSD